MDLVKINKLAQQTFNYFNDLKQSMRFVFLIILISLLYHSPAICQDILDNKTDFHVNNLTIDETLLELSDVIDFPIAFKSNLFSAQKTITLSVQNESIRNILTKCLAGTSVHFQLRENRIVLTKRIIKKHTISGYIRDKDNLEKLVGGTIWNSLSNEGVTSNNYGYFSISLPEGNVQLNFSYLGYTSEQRDFYLNENRRLDIPLKSSLTLEEIVISNSSNFLNSNMLNLGKGRIINAKQINQHPSTAGESDIIRYLQSQPGVQSGADGLGGLHVRGGNASQNLILLDDVNIFNPSHTFGLFSIFNTSTIRSTQFIKDGFSARHGGRLSSVLDIRTREGNTKSLIGIFEISSLSTKALLEIPIQSDKSGILISARRSHIDPIIKQRSTKSKKNEDLVGETGYYFYDFNFKFHTSIGLNDRLYLSLYKGNDFYDDSYGYAYDDRPYTNDYWSNNTEQDMSWGNEIAAIRWNHIFGEKIFMNSTFTYSNYKYKSRNEWKDISNFDEEYNYYHFLDHYSSAVKDIGLKIDLDYYPNNKHQIKFGLAGKYRDFKPGAIGTTIKEDSINAETAVQYIDENFSTTSLNALEINSYFEDNINLSNDFKLLAGLHNAVFINNNKTYFSLQPRVSFLWKNNRHHTIQGTVGRMTQYLHVLTSSGAGLPTDMWVPSTNKIAPEDGWQYALTNEIKWNEKWLTKMALFYKTMDGLISYVDQATLPKLFTSDPLFWEEEVTTGKGWSYGIELELSKHIGKTKLDLSYTYSRSFRQFDYINNDASFPFDFDRPHDFKINVSRQLNPAISLQLAWVISSGQSITLLARELKVNPFDNFGSFDDEIRSSINGYKLPTYHRLDLNLQIKIDRNRFDHVINIGVYNTYNRKNPYYAYILESEFDFIDDGIQYLYALPLIPSISYQLRFGGH